MALIITLLYWGLQIYSLIMLARVLLSWFPNIDRSNPIVELIFNLTEPVLRPVRNALPPTSGIDFSPVVVMIGLWVLMRVVLFM